MNDQTATPVIFNHGDIQLSQAVMINGIPHFTRRAIGKFLEYSKSQEAIDTLLQRNPYIEDYASHLNLRCEDGTNREVSVYHPQGFLLICMESQTEKAKRMKEAIAAFVWDQIKPSGLSTKEEVDLMKILASLVRGLASTRDAFERAVLVQSLQRVCRRLNMSIPDPALLYQDPTQMELPFK